MIRLLDAKAVYREPHTTYTHLQTWRGKLWEGNESQDLDVLTTKVIES